MTAKKTLEVHDQENSQESQDHLEENRVKFSKQCLKVWELLRQGKRLTTMNAPTYGILSLPRRVADLRENGVHIDDQWLYDSEGKRTVKEWFINFKTVRETKKSLTEFAARYVKELPQKLEQPELFKK